MDGTPTTLVFDLEKDDPEVLSWIGLSGLDDGERQWFDLGAAPIASEYSSNGVDPPSELAARS
jgi:hypothetical protein